MISVTVTNLTSDIGPSTLTPVKSLNSSPFNLLTVIIIVVLFCLVFLIVIIAIQRKRRLDRLRHSLIPFYSFDANEEEDWDSDLLNNENSSPMIRSYGSVELNVMFSEPEKRRSKLL
ncbi:small integral membrane protein 29-like isoform X2 [Daktulosphaira vitifoliae]|uniref:small integral membrane protein 29-like isoform X2 n=1 Tax=Daktulosphaira vitifoliae TaxID=58002 RepID=UPI0021AA290A|nr:small integral membrane protein 29-like isoform X2 [Daktulosphaira vitifoliae]